MNQICTNFHIKFKNTVTLIKYLNQFWEPDETQNEINILLLNILQLFCKSYFTTIKSKQMNVYII